DQPDVVRLPDRADRAVDLVPDPLGALALPRQEVPDAGAEVGAAEERVERYPDPEDHRADVGVAHGSASLAPPDCGEYGRSVSAAPGPSRHRRDSARRISTAVVNSPM